MEQSQIEQFNAELATAEEGLHRAVKALKKPSTIAFAERRAVSAKAEKAIAELQARKSELEADAAAEGLAEKIQESLDAAAKAQHAFEASQPAGLARSGAQVRNVPGSSRRGAAGGSQRTSSPRKVGGE